MSRTKEEQETFEKDTLNHKPLVLKPPVSREDLLRHTETDPEGAEEFLRFLKESRRDRGVPPATK